MSIEKYNVLDIFCGAGGMSKGFEAAGLNIAYAVDKDVQAMRTYKLNHYNTKLIEDDIRNISFNEFKGIDFIIGGFPCTAFSNANRTKIIDHPDKLLFKQYLRAIDEIRPKIFVMENVNGILREDSGRNSVIKEIINHVEPLGYIVNKWAINMAYWGLPQKRERVIVIGSKIGKVDITHYNQYNNLGLVTVKEAISDLEYMEPCSNKEKNKFLLYNRSPESGYQIERRKGCNKLFNHLIINHGEKFINKVKYIPEGCNWRSIPYKFVDKTMSSHDNSYRRLEYNNQSITIVNVRKCCVLHPLKNRVLTAREAARLQGFDDDYVFEGTKDSIYQQIANAVSPIVAKIIASDILKSMKRILD